MKILCIDGPDSDACLTLALCLSKELKRRRYQTAVWDQRDPADAIPEDTDMFLTNRGMCWPADKKLEDFLPLLRSDVLLICGRLPELPYVWCGEGFAPKGADPDAFVFDRVAPDQAGWDNTA